MHKAILKAIGPGILFAGAAIGVSHLVQSTRAGALFGLWLLPVVLAAHAAKYPAMVFGPRYAAATGHSLVEAYRQQGRWALAIFALIAVGTSFTILAAVTIVTAAVIRTSLGIETLGVFHLSLILLTISAAVVALGGFRWLDAALKLLMTLLLAATLLAAAFVIPRIDWAAASAVPAGLTVAAIPFIVALVGWMPAPLDITVWHSLWTLDRAKQTGHNPTSNQCRFDFNLGYTLCAITACCFLILGAVGMHQAAVAPAENSTQFITQLFNLYTAATASGSACHRIAASAVMLSQHSQSSTHSTPPNRHRHRTQPTKAGETYTHLLDLRRLHRQGGRHHPHRTILHGPPRPDRDHHLLRRHAHPRHFQPPRYAQPRRPAGTPAEQGHDPRKPRLHRDLVDLRSRLPHPTPLKKQLTTITAFSSKITTKTGNREDVLLDSSIPDEAP